MLDPVLRQRLHHALASREAWWRRPRFLVPVGVLAAYALLGFLALPAWLRHALPDFARGQLGAQATVGELRINPFLATLEARDVALADAAGEPVLGFARLFIDFEFSSPLHRAWTFADLQLEQPVLDLQLARDGRLNLQRLLEALPPAEPAAAGEPARVLLQRLAVVGGRLRYADLRGAEAVRAEFGPLSLQLDDIATIAGQRGQGSAQIGLPGGARLAWSGELGLHPLASGGAVQLQGLEPRQLWDFARGRLRLAPPAGVIDASFDYEFATDGGAPTLRADALRVGLRDLALQRSDDAAPLLALAAIELEGGSVDLAARSIGVESLRVNGGRVAAAIDAAGVLDWSTLVPDAPGAAAPAPVASGAPARPWRLDLEAFALQDVALALADASRAAPLALDLAARSLGFGVSGVIGAGAPQLQLSGGALELADVALVAGAQREALARLASLSLAGVRADLGARRVQAQRLAMHGLQTALERSADGTIRQLALLAATGDAGAVAVPESAAREAAPAWSVALGELAVEGIEAALADASTQPALAYTVAGGKLVLRDIDTAAAAPLALEATLPIAQGGRIGLGGSAAADGSAASLRLDVEQLALAPLAPLVTQRTVLALGSGSLFADAALDYRRGANGKPVLAVTGSAGVDGLLLTEAATGERFLAWRKLLATGIDLGLGPDRLSVRELRLTEPGAKFVVLEDRSTNLAQVLRASPPAVPAADVPEQAAAPQAAAAFPVTVERVRVENATVDFSDHSLVLPFAARIVQLNGSARGISPGAESRATLAFAGRVGEFGEAAIDGRLAPFDPARFTDIEVRFRNIAMNPLSPYSATFAGRTIERGDMDVALDYKMQDGILAGENRIVLQDLQLGEKIESPGALDLPLDLAIALLSDAEGRIDVEVPVSGDVGDPQFSYGHVIGQAIGKLITGVVTAPFRALGGLFGGAADSESLAVVRFTSGSAELMPRERERIARLADALAARPRLGVDVRPGVAPARDGYAVRRLIVRRAHAEELGLELASGEDPGAVAYDEAKSQRALEKLLEAREGEDAPAAFAAAYAREHGREPARVNPALALVGRASEDHEYYRALYLHLVHGTPEPGAELQALARGRAEAVVAELAARGVEPPRLRIAAPAELAEARPSGVLLALELVARDG